MQKLRLPPLPQQRKKAPVVHALPPKLGNNGSRGYGQNSSQAQEAQNERTKDKRQLLVPSSSAMPAPIWIFAAELARILRTEVKAKADLAAIAGLLTDAPVSK
jgi:hypothetical protein